MSTRVDPSQMKMNFAPLAPPYKSDSASQKISVPEIFRASSEKPIAKILKPTVASLFAGCGGLDLGFQLAGFELKWANDFNHWACETYKRNFGDHVTEGDVADIDPEQIPNVDVILGGFPCQDFSVLWKRGGLNTERGNLYRHFVRIVEAKNPKIFVAENVKGLLTANKGEAVKQIVRDFAALGYRVTINKVNFSEYGAPQHRQRVLIIGVRSDIDEEFKFPAPTHDKSNYETASKALSGSPPKSCAVANKLNQAEFCGSCGLSFSPR